jgi:hypothetical protein
MTLRFVGSDHVPMDRLTFMWIQITHFAAITPADDRALITELIRSPQYAYDYASPFDPEHAVVEPAVHGRWWRDSLHAWMFRRCSAVDAEAVLQSWCDDQDWTPPGFQQSPAAQGRLRDVFLLLRVGDVHRLQNPSRDVEHEYGFVTGGLGFHEFVVIDRANGAVHLIVASDD